MGDMRDPKAGATLVLIFRSNSDWDDGSEATEALVNWSAWSSNFTQAFLRSLRRELLLFYTSPVPG